MIKLDIENYKGKYAMYCETYEEAKAFCDYLMMIGRKWNSGGSYSNTLNDNTGIYYFFNEGRYCISKECTSGYTILYAKDFLIPILSKENEFTWKDLQASDVVVFKHGKSGVCPEYVKQINGEAYISITTKYTRVLDIKESFEELGVKEIRRPSKPEHLYIGGFRKAPVIYKVEKKAEKKKDAETLEQKFRKMWNWLADNPREGKLSYFEHNGISGKHVPTHHCYACEYTKDEHNCIRCEDCPLDRSSIGCYSKGGLYNTWAQRFSDEDYREASELARAIANLRWDESKKNSCGK